MSEKLKISVLDGLYTNPGDLSWDPVEALGEVTIYQQSTQEEAIDRAKEADIIVINKIKIDEHEMEQLPKLKMIAISATGTDNVNLEAAKARQIEVKNAVGYSTNSVAQHVFALLLEMTNRVARHHSSIREGEWNEQRGFSYTLQTIPELSQMKFGIYGFGKIGQKVASIAKAFGMQVYLVSNHASEEDYPFYRLVDLPTLFKECDVISLHAPLRSDNEQIVDKKLLSQMKSSAYLINTARGGLINESDLHDALTQHKLAAAALDVLTEEPPAPDHPLTDLQNCIITPHMAWTSQRARKELIDIVANNIKDFQG